MLNKKNIKGIKIVPKNLQIFEDKVDNGRKYINDIPQQKEVSFKKLVQINNEKNKENKNQIIGKNNQILTNNKEISLNNGVIETVEYPLSKLPNINIDGSKPMDFYYPYFFKSNVIHYNQNNQVLPVSNVCLDLKCEMCDRLNIDNCLRCRHGFFLHERKCLLSCPFGYIANIFEGRCVLQRENSRIFLK
jgi:hypothetical protein